VIVERAQNSTHGDYSVTLPLKLAKLLRRSPMAIATELAAAMTLAPAFAGTEPTFHPREHAGRHLQPLGRGALHHLGRLTQILECGCWCRSR